METSEEVCMGNGGVTLTSGVNSCHLVCRTSTCPPWLRAALAGYYFMLLFLLFKTPLHLGYYYVFSIGSLCILVIMIEKL